MVRRTRLIFIRQVLLLTALTLSNPAVALRCGSALVNVGHYKGEVLKKCGDPESVDTHIEKKAVSSAGGLSQYYGNGALNLGQQQYYEIDIVVEEWFYNFGPNRFQQLLRFENGKLTEIKDLGYGY